MMPPDTHSADIYRTPPLVNIVGCGNLGRTLGHLWHRQGLAGIGQILNPTLQSACAAVDFIAAGKPLDDIRELSPADVWLIATPDDAIALTVQKLAAVDLSWPSATVLHCSGAHSSDLLAPLAACGASCASVHPLHSFAQPEASIHQLADCYCSAEGDTAAQATLRRLFEPLGLHWFAVRPEAKLVYHAAAVFACNYLTTLLDASSQCLSQSGVYNQQPLQVLMPLIQQTLDNIEQKGPQQALSGPVKRGDTALIRRQWQALQAFQPTLADSYAHLAKQTLHLANLSEINPQAERDIQDFLHQLKDN